MSSPRGATTAGTSWRASRASNRPRAATPRAWCFRCGRTRTVTATSRSRGLRIPRPRHPGFQRTLHLRRLRRGHDLRDRLRRHHGPQRHAPGHAQADLFVRPGRGGRPLPRRAGRGQGVPPGTLGDRHGRGRTRRARAWPPTRDRKNKPPFHPRTWIFPRILARPVPRRQPASGCHTVPRLIWRSSTGLRPIAHTPRPKPLSAISHPLSLCGDSLPGVVRRARRLIHVRPFHKPRSRVEFHLPLRGRPGR